MNLDIATQLNIMAPELVKASGDVLRRRGRFSCLKDIAAMTLEAFTEAMLWLEGELRREGLSLSQIESIERDAMRITEGEFAQTPAEYIQTVNRLAASGLY